MSGYHLIDFGNGRKLESLAGYVVDRPSPSAQHAAPRLARTAWLAAGARFDNSRRAWDFRQPWPAACDLDTGQFRLPFRPKPFGHINCFPEQLPNWRWLAQTVSRLRAEHTAGDDSATAWQPECLNLFAHTGGSTLAMAVAGAAVTHVDAAKPSVTAARQFAAANHLADAKIRYLVEDAARYVARQRRRNQTYDVIVLDPPSYGHGTGGKTWRLSRDLWPLLDDCVALLRSTGAALLVTGHSESPNQNDIADYLRQITPVPMANRFHVDSGRAELLDLAGRPLDAGYYVRAIW